MTIKDYLRRRAQRIRKLTIWWLIGVTATWVIWSTFFPPAPDVKPVVACAMLLGLFFSIAMFKRTNCPRCGESLSGVAARFSSPQRYAPATSCPHCGVEFDDPVEGPPREPVLDRQVTIRSSVERRAEKFAPLVYVAIVGFFVCYFGSQATVRITGAVVAAAAVLLAAIFAFRLPCPKCGHALGLLPWRLNRKNVATPAKCPTCGTGVDEPIERPVNCG